jgi:hypothetical protein
MTNPFNSKGDSMDTSKRSFNKRAFTAIMSGLTALTLPFTGLVLHGFSEGAVSGDRHSWFMLHVVFGVLFVACAAWHAWLNRRPLLNYIKAGGGSRPGN